MTSTQRATNWLLGSNLRPTRQRLVLAEILVGDGKHRHVTAESLFEQVNKRADKVSLATVYNTLHTFCHAGLVQEITVDGSKSYFDTRTVYVQFFSKPSKDERLENPPPNTKTLLVYSTSAGSTAPRAPVVSAAHFPRAFPRPRRPRRSLRAMVRARSDPNPARLPPPASAFRPRI